MPRQSKPFLATSPIGEVFEAKDVAAFAEKHKLAKNHVYDCLNRKRMEEHGWTFRYADQDNFESDSKDDGATLESLGLDINIEELGNYPKDRIRRMIRGAIIRVVSIQTQIDAGKRERPPGFDSSKTIKSLKEVAASFDVDFREVQDQRSDLQKAIDLADKIALSPLSALEELDEVLITTERAMDSTIALGREYFLERLQKVRERAEQIGDEPPDPKACWSALARWLATLRKLRKIRRWARERVPHEAATEHNVYAPRFTQARLWEATYTLRYMLYVGRSDLSADKPSDLIFKIGRHIVKACIDLWEAWERVGFTIHGIYKPGEIQFEGAIPFPGVDYQGIILMMPPRHTKTSLLRHWLGERINEDRRTKAAYTHARTEEAKAFVGHVGSLYDLNTSTGRRNYTIKPFELAEFDNKANKIRLENGDPSKEPNLTGAGIGEAAQGKDLTILIGDDLVPQTDVDEPTTRENRKSRWKGTWMTRLEESASKSRRGGFFVLSGYPWHHDDLMWSEQRRARLAGKTNGTQGVVARLSMQPVGGPPDFKPIWPEVFPARVLRQKYRTLHNPSVWAANYELQPETDELRLVRRIALYDVDSPLHHQFLAECETYLSIDPTATSNRKSDRAGVVTLGVGDTVAFRQGVHGEFIEMRRSRIRVLSAREFHAGQTELAETLGHELQVRPVSGVFIEIVTGLGGPIRDHLITYHGVGNIIACRPGPNNGKGQRLRSVAAMLEASNSQFEPIVEFPARKDSAGNLEPDGDDVKRLINYVVNFRTTSGHHSLDALTQALAKLAPQVGTMSKSRDSDRIHRLKGTRKRKSLEPAMRGRGPEADDVVGRMMQFCRGGEA